MVAAYKTVGELSDYCVQQNELLGVLDRCRTSPRQEYKPGVTSVDNILTCFARKRLVSGRLVSLLISRTCVNCGSHLINCLVVVAHLQLRSMRLAYTKPSMTRSLLSSLLLLVLVSRPSLQLQPIVCLFRPVTQADVTQMIRALPDKQCSSDPLPTWLLKTNVDLLAPFLCHLFCHSLEHGVVPSRMKAAYITPIVKKAHMDPTETKSY